MNTVQIIGTIALVLSLVVLVGGAYYVSHFREIKSSRDNNSDK